MKVKNIYTEPKGNPDDQEVFETLLQNENLLIERIVTRQPYEFPGEWYKQKKDEWVILLQGEAEIEFKDGEITTLSVGDYIFIPAHKIHRVKRSGFSVKCIWLAIHGNLK